MSGLGFINGTEPYPIYQTCESCGIIAETRPYGPNDERICFDCGMKDQETTERKMAAYIFGNNDL